MTINIDKKTQERIKKDLEVVKKKIVSKRGQFPIRERLRDFLAEHYLIPHNADSIGRGHCEDIIDTLFRKERPLYANSKGETHWSRHCLARAYQDFWPNHWDIMKKYLKRFFRIRPYQRELPNSGYDFDPWDQPPPKDYPTPKEKLKASEKARRVGRDRLSEREEYALKISYEEYKEEESEHIYHTLSLIGHPYGWTLPDSNFRYIVLFEPDLKEFWKWCGLEINDNLKFFLSKSVQTYHWAIFYGRKYKIPKLSPFTEDCHKDYAQLKAELIKRTKVPKKVFERIEDSYLSTQLQDLIPLLSHIVKPLFLVAHFLEREDRHIYDCYLKEIKSYLGCIDSADQTKKNWAVSQVGLMRHQDFLFNAVWQDYLFDRKIYLRKPKEKTGRRGRPLSESNYLLVLLVVTGVEKYSSRLNDTVYRTAAALINFLTREDRFNINAQSTEGYHNLGAEAVRRIYTEARKRFRIVETRV